MKSLCLPKSRYFLHFLILLMIIVFLFYKMNRLLIYSEISLSPNHMKTSSDKTLSSSSSTLEPLIGGHFRILLWTKYFGEDKWAQLKLKDWNCSYSNCLLTDDRRHLSDSDAVFFHWRDVDTKDLPHYHKPDQKWVLYNWESPHYTPEGKVKPLIEDIDWMMTYRKDSDIYSPYGSVQKCRRKWDKEDMFEKKTKSVAWIVSNCLTPGNREGYVKELATHIDVDIYGACGQHMCPRDETCFQMIEKTYKFYLSFENSLCKDYVTEKLFRTLDYNIIPIVYGSADYKHLMPNNSFINVNDFPSAKELSDYLKTIGRNKQKYNSYLKWKSSHCVRQTEYRYFCDLCQKLNQNLVKNTDNNRVVSDSNKTVVKSKRKGIDWWYKEAECQLKNSAGFTIDSIFIYNIFIFVLFVYCLDL